MSILLKEITSSSGTITFGQPLTLYVKAKRIVATGKLTEKVTISVRQDGCTFSPKSCEVTIPEGGSEAVVPVTITLKGPGNLATVTVLATLGTQEQPCTLSVSRGAT